jgi:GNAT superfamily N-acetyltransferase
LESQVEIRRIEASDACLFHRLASASTLRSLRDPFRRQELLDRGFIIAAFCGNRPIGCSCLETDVGRPYIGLNGQACSLPPSCVYLCSTFVLPERRGSGVGLRLYTERLRAAQSLERSTLAVEILGTGTPLTIDPISYVGYRFHRDAGFSVAGYSAEADHGPLLMWQML